MIIDAMANLVTVKQREDEGLIVYTGRFKAAINIFHAQLGGPLPLMKHVRQMPNFGPETSDLYDKQANEQLIKQRFNHKPASFGAFHLL